MRDIRSYQNGNWNSVTQLPKDHSGLRAPSEHHFRVRRRGVFFAFHSLSLLCLIVSGQTAISVWEQEYAPIGSSCGGTFFTQRGAVGFRRGEKLHTAVNTANPQWKRVFFFLFLFCSLIGSFLASLLHAFILWLKREAIYVHKESKRVLSLVATLVSYTFPMYMSLLSH